MTQRLADEQEPIFYMCKIANRLTHAASNQTAPRIYRPDELLTAKEATSMVGYTVTLEAGSLYTSTDLGYISERYVFDIPSEGSTSTTTIHALLQITQNGLISTDNLKQGMMQNGISTLRKNLAPTFSKEQKPAKR